MKESTSAPPPTEHFREMWVVLCALDALHYIWPMLHGSAAGALKALRTTFLRS